MCVYIYIYKHIDFIDVRCRFKSENLVILPALVNTRILGCQHLFYNYLRYSKEIISSGPSIVTPCKLYLARIQFAATQCVDVVSGTAACHV